MLIDQISVFIENAPGRLAEATNAIAKAGVDIRALSLADTTDFGILRLIVDAPEKAIQALKAEGMTVKTTKVIAVSLPDQPGALANVLAVLHSADISLEYAYAFLTKEQADACVILRVEDNERAAKILEQNKISLIKKIAL